MATPKEHIEEIRTTKFSIGGKPNPLTEDLHHAVKNLSAELYAKDVHFLMELIQNAEDNHYIDGESPTLEFVITYDDITGTGIGFKSVFLVTAQPYIFSNGYQIRFNERPCPHCKIGYVVPEWVEKPTLVDIKKIYGGGKDSLPTTTIVLPLKPDKVIPVRKQLSNIHPEVLLFLSKIRHLSVKEQHKVSKQNTVTVVSISSEINFMTRKNMNAESYTIHLSAGNNSKDKKECSYYMWKQKFPVKLKNVVERRMAVEECVVSLAFPFQERLHKDKSLPGVYAFLPTEMVTNFPFIIQADFVLASSRETILFDDKWNQGILEYVPSAFIDAFKTLITCSGEAPVSNLPYMFKFLPIHSSSYEKFNHVRQKIKSTLDDENILPIETFTNQKHFYKPREVSRLLPKFWNILMKAQQKGVYLLDLSSHDGMKILSSSFDKSEYDHILKFLGVKLVNTAWYAKCIQSSNLVDGISEDIYLELLLFVSRLPSSKFFRDIPLIKYVASDGILSFSSLHECAEQGDGAKRVVLVDSSNKCPCSWLINWNNVFACATNQFFMPESTQQAITKSPNKYNLLAWLGNDVNIRTLDLYSFAHVLCSSINNNCKLAIAYAHFLYHSLSKGYLSSQTVYTLCRSMPLVDKFGRITKSIKGVLLPADVSKWANLIGSNPWRNENYVELGKVYLNDSSYAGQHTDSGKLIEFLKIHVGASDIPYISPPNAGFSAADTPLTKDNAFLLLDWIRDLKKRGVDLPERFLECIKGGRWLKVTGNGYMPPSKSFLIGSSLGKLLQSGSVLVDIPLVDESFYGDRINEYKEELKTVGVMFSCEEACEFIGIELMSRAGSFSLSRSHALLMLNFIQYIKKSLIPLDKFVDSIRKGSWLKTSCGLRSPVGSVLNDSGWRVASSQISDVPFIDHAYFGEEIYNYKEELKLLGVIVDLSENYQVIIENLKLPSNLASLTTEAVLLILECIRHSNAPIELLNLLKGTSCLKTNIGFKTPGEWLLEGTEYRFPSDFSTIIDNKLTIEDDFRKRLSKNWLKTHAGYRPPEKCLLFDSKWSSFLNPTAGPFIDQNFYGPEIASFQKELNAIGVINEVEKGCSLLASYLESLSDHDTIVKIYKFLCEHNWKPEEKAARKIWILDGVKGGKWVDSKECIVHDPAKLFSSKFYVLEDIYVNSGLLLFFYFAMEIKNKPSLEDYVDLWNDWGSSMEKLSYDECCRFWMSISKHLSTNEEKILAESLMKLPTTSGNNEIFLVDKENAFIPDNLHMKKLFEKEKVFVWYPQYNMTPLSKSKLSDIYRKIGARNISESLCKDESSLVNDGGKLKYVDPNNFFNLKGLVKIILGFLACSSLKMEPKKRHEAVQSLINLSFHETMEPINVSYSLSLSSGDIITKKANKRVHWESQSCKFIIQKTDGVPGDSLQHATNFSEAISEGILRENHDHVPALAELITLGFVMKFKSEEVDFLMESKNLQIDLEDEEFLSSAFPFD
ncbi:hypothetical protein TSUD_354450 [Trifolium subterraneum]|uniref:Uncharacterized protein n=1 Tax=Trifolium subterraneum TaxID=3900 RepID=A0A2Z6P0W9_TRISU|nr:hypothetical protein TSUD_354450 [Trifolium subterraneum]